MDALSIPSFTEPIRMEYENVLGLGLGTEEAVVKKMGNVPSLVERPFKSLSEKIPAEPCQAPDDAVTIVLVVFVIIIITVNAALHY